MDKKTFLKTLSAGLIRYGIEDYADIIKDYENHFLIELAKGKTEEEISRELGDIKQIIKDYAQNYEKPKQKSVIILGLTLQDIFLIPLMILLYGVFVALMAGALVSTAIGVYLNLALKNLSFIPQLIIPLNFLYGLAFFALACFLFGFSMLYLIYINKVVRASIMWQKSLLSEKYGGNNVISSLNDDKYKKIALYSGIVFLSLFAAAYVVSAIVAGSFEFWHVWKWFGK